MSIYSLIEIFTAHILITNIGKLAEPVWRKFQNIKLPISSGPPDRSHWFVEKEDIFRARLNEIKYGKKSLSYESSQILDQINN